MSRLLLLLVLVVLLQTDPVIAQTPTPPQGQLPPPMMRAVPSAASQTDLLPGEKAVEFEYVIEGERKKGTCRVLTLDIGGGETIEFVRIPKGKFTMGSPKGEASWQVDNISVDYEDVEDPQHEVEITRDFYLGRYVVNQAQYRTITGKNPSHFKGDRLPVDQVIWDEADDYCKVLAKKLRRKISLPSEAQWEYACRAGTRTPFYFGSKLNGDLANCSGDGPYGTKMKGPVKGKTTVVGSYPANPWGLYDMSGNVYQWCEDWLGSYSKLEGSRDPIQINGQGWYKVARGGSWKHDAGSCRSAFRLLGWFENDVKSDPQFGFRVLVSLEK